MAINIAVVKRVFIFNGINLPDPGPDFTPEEVRDVYSAQFPDIVTAAIEEPTFEGDVATYKMVRNVGTKG